MTASSMPSDPCQYLMQALRECPYEIDDEGEAGYQGDPGSAFDRRREPGEVPYLSRRKREEVAAAGMTRKLQAVAHMFEKYLAVRQCPPEFASRIADIRIEENGAVRGIVLDDVPEETRVAIDAFLTRLNRAVKLFPASQRTTLAHRCLAYLASQHTDHIRALTLKIRLGEI
jgi:hypothetical protein